MNVRAWMPKEDNYIKENFGKVTYSQMANTLNCSIKTVQKRAEYLGFEVETKTIRRWTDEEIELLKIMAPKYLNKTIARKLDRSLNEVNKKARQLGIELIFKRPVWKKWKVKFLKENVNKMSLEQIKKELDVGYYQIMDKLDELGIEYIGLIDKWSDEEVSILKELAPKCYYVEIAKVLDRSPDAIKSKINKLGLDYVVGKKEFSEEEKKYIKDNWGVVSVVKMAEDLKASRVTIQTVANNMGLPKLGSNPYRKWTNEEVSELRKLSKNKTITELAKKFKTTKEAIITVGYRNDIEFIDEKIHWSNHDNMLLKEYAKTMDLQEIADKMNRTIGAVRSQARRQGIDIIKNKDYQDKIWTPDDYQKLEKLAGKGKTAIEIAKALNKSDQTILKKAREKGISINKLETKEWTNEEIEKLILLSKTKKMSELARELERPSSVIRDKAKELGINIIPDRKRWTKEEYELLEKLTMQDKKTPKEIASILGRTEDAIIIKINRRGLQVQTNDKRFWKKEEEDLLSDLWGSTSKENIAKKLNRTVSSITNKAVQLGLGSYLENNYDGLTVKEIAEILDISENVVRNTFFPLGLKYKNKKITKTSEYKCVDIDDLFDFLEKHQNIWDSKSMEKNILGKEPDWLKEKRKNDLNKEYNKNIYIHKENLILEGKYYLDDEKEKEKASSIVLTKDKK